MSTFSTTDSPQPIRDTSMRIPDVDMKSFLDARVQQYNNVEFIHSDPVQIPHRFSRKEDIEIAA